MRYMLGGRMNIVVPIRSIIIFLTLVSFIPTTEVFIDTHNLLPSALVPVPFFVIIPN